MSPKVAWLISYMAKSVENMTEEEQKEFFWILIDIILPNLKPKKEEKDGKSKDV